MSNEALAALLGGVAGTVTSLVVVLFAALVERKPDESYVALSIAAIAVRLRRQVLFQFVNIHKGANWTLEAIEHQREILTELDELLPLMRRRTPDAYVHILATREAILSNVTRLVRWTQGGKGPDQNAQQLGSTLASHLELFAAAHLANKSLSYLPSEQSLRARRLATEVARLREEGTAKLRALTDDLNRLSPDQREEWVRTGLLP